MFNIGKDNPLKVRAEMQSKTGSRELQPPVLCNFQAALAQLGERQTEDLKAPCSIHGGGIYF